ncbi:hypothetical protein NAC44_16765 [Allorhizobium sp. BGMRC 0089]|uniref:hypothetical protein n=1 Tax=Allorhizobium sonneratiae TaxID=2934936 RepID=UPI0020342C67|nr:hypothetical protein [Allorhizobium sonneratiae]MCM2293980.1 hypothetical protein [Allorhizobium sonneratiae]
MCFDDHVTEYRLAVIGRDYLVTEDIRKNWKKQGVDLLGPIPSADAASITAEQVHGILIDVCESAETMVQLVEQFEMRALPFLFIAHADDVIGRYSPYTLTIHPDDIDEILRALMWQGDDGARH